MIISRRGFTLLEMIIVTVIVGSIFVIVISLYSKMVQAKVDTESKQALIYGSYSALEKLNVLMKDYTIDYEEYFNRRVVGCDGNGGSTFSWTGSSGVGNNGYCDKFTSYGNSGWNSNKWGLYYCSSATDENGSPNFVYNQMSMNGSGCWDNATYGNGRQHSFGEYKLQYIDTKSNIDGTGGVVGDDDDVDTGKGPVALGDNTNTQELYLISKDGKKRISIRRAFLSSGDWNFDGTVGNKDIDKLYSLQMLKLRGFDAGASHNFDSDNTDGDYDGDIDTWACDYGEGFKCNGSPIGSLYSGYNLPSSVNDGYTNIFGNDITIVDWKLEVYPVKKSSYSFNEDNMQMNPYVKVYIKTKLYGEPWSWKINPSILDNYQLDLQTTFNIRNSY